MRCFPLLLSGIHAKSIVYIFQPSWFILVLLLSMQLLNLKLLLVYLVSWWWLSLQGHDNVVVARGTVRESWTRQQDARRLSSMSACLPCAGRQVRLRTTNTECNSSQPGQTTHRATRCLQPAASDQTRWRDVDGRRGDAPVRRQTVSAAVAVVRLWRRHRGLPRRILTVFSFHLSAFVVESVI